jgi:hypothetical protein
MKATQVIENGLADDAGLEEEDEAAVEEEEAVEVSDEVVGEDDELAEDVFGAEDEILRNRAKQATSRRAGVCRPLQRPGRSE